MNPKIFLRLIISVGFLFVISTGAATLSLFPTSRACAGARSNKIFGGVETEIDEFPWMALIEYEKKNSKGFHCGGSLISTRYILTAAHCVNPKSIPADWKPINVRLGEWDMSTNPDCMENDCSDPHKNISIEKIIVHEEYNHESSTQPNDIALIRLAEDVEFTDFIQPLCLPWSNELQTKTYVGKALDVAGWGKTERSTTNARKLKAMVKGVDHSECVPAYRKLGVLLNTKQLCAGGEFGVDTCRGDSGGSLVAVDSTSGRPYYLAVGVVSFGPIPCGQAGIPGVYTKVADYVPWIRNKVE
ncbi:CLIPB1 family protein [Megaselia abdita]